MNNKHIEIVDTGVGEDSCLEVKVDGVLVGKNIEDLARALEIVLSEFFQCFITYTCKDEDVRE